MGSATGGAPHVEPFGTWQSAALGILFAVAGQIFEFGSLGVYALSDGGLDIDFAFAGADTGKFLPMLLAADDQFLFHAGLP